MGLGSVVFAAIAAVAATLAPKPVDSASTAVHVVQPGDSLWQIARAHGCSVEHLAAPNDLDRVDVLRVGTALDLQTCLVAADGGRPHGTLHEVLAGETFVAVAQRHGTTVDVLLQLNNWLDDSLHAGDVLLVPPPGGHSVRLIEGQSLGRPQRGRLAAAVSLPSARGYHLRRPDRAFGARHVVDYTTAVLDLVRSTHPRLHRIAIGDLSAASGGWLSGHRSHQSGRDVDIGLCFRQAPAGYPEEFVPFDVEELDVAAMWTLVSAFAATHPLPGGVERVFLDYDIQQRLYEYGKERKVPDSQLHMLFQAPDGRYARHGIVRHVRKHHDHVHVRFRCIDDDPRCR